jgi:hypothetical protein
MPFGRPSRTVHAYGGCPPVAVSVSGPYGAPVAPAGRTEWLTVSAGVSTTRLMVDEATLPLESRTVTCTVCVPRVPAAGAPPSTPPGDRVSPAGSPLPPQT